jgi:hypothetical protein
MKSAFNLFDPQKCENRWICYFDILGFKSRLNTRGMIESVHGYYQCREIIENNIRQHSRLHLQCLSDTFIVCSSDDSAASFWQIEQAARWIINLNLAKGIPLRGAISCGETYIVEEDNICIGKALNEAYQFSDNLNWIGMPLCRSATQRLTILKLAPSKRLNYRRVKFSWKRKIPGLKPLYAYLIGASTTQAGQNNYLEILHQMMSEVDSTKDKAKYQQIVSLLECYGTMKPV